MEQNFTRVINKCSLFIIMAFICNLDLFAQDHDYVIKLDAQDLYRLIDKKKIKVGSKDNIFYYTDTVFFSTRSAYIKYKKPESNQKIRKSEPFQQCSIKDVILGGHRSSTLAPSGKSKGDDNSDFYFLEEKYEAAIKDSANLLNELDVSVQIHEEGEECYFLVYNKTDSIIFFDIINASHTLSVFSLNSYWDGFMIYPYSELMLPIDDTHYKKGEPIIFLASNKRFLTNKLGRSKIKAKSMQKNDIRITIIKI